MNFLDRDLDYDFDFDADGDVDGDFESDLDYDRDFDFDGDMDRDVRGSGRGLERDDRPDFEETAMPMTRRDVDALYDFSARDTDRFLGRRAGAPKKDTGEDGVSLLVGSAEVVGGAMAAAFLAQRFKRQGVIVPAGIVLGILAHVGSYLGVFGASGAHFARFGTGLIAGSSAVWAAGHGTLAAQGTDVPNVAAIGPQPQPQAVAYAPQPPQQVYASQQPYAPQQTFAPQQAFAQPSPFAPAQPSPFAFAGQQPLSAAEYANIFRSAA